MTSQIFPWIRRKIANEIYDRIITDDNSAIVYVVQASAGVGKTYLARDIGTCLGSPTGYEPARQGKVVWSGILDIYDPDTNSNQGVERRLISVFSPNGLEFEGYQAARDMYSAWHRGGISGTTLEEQRHKVEEAFSQGLQEVAKTCRPAIVLDTIERLECTADTTQQELCLFDDTASIMGWLIFQITYLSSGVVLLLGRRAERFYQALREAVAQANQSRSGRVPIELRYVDLGQLEAEELDEFFAERINRYPPLKRLLTDDLKQLLAVRMEGNPLLLDLALQALLETGNPTLLQQSLAGEDGLQAAYCALLQAYMNSLENSDRHILLLYLALARNGLFADLLRSLEPGRAERLIEELKRMEALPFIRVRSISMSEGECEADTQRRTYFLHDAMHAACDEILLRPEQVAQDSRRILAWYEKNTEARQSNDPHRLGDVRYFGPDLDLFIESVFYRMRADPATGYQWYLQQADQAIRNTETGLDMRLRDALALFLTSASEEEPAEPGQSLSSPIDRANVQALAPHLFHDYRLDSATLWIRRYTMRGKRKVAEQIGRATRPWAEEMVRQYPERYRLAWAEFLLWYSQAIMYGFDIEDALAMYQSVIKVLEPIEAQKGTESKTDEGRLSEFDWRRSSLVRGRTYNNLGYAHWVYKGKYRLAIQEFQQAIHLFRSLDPEELANSSDNLGRVYALLGYEFQAVQLINNGLEIRQAQGLTYRQALSLNSLAMVLIRFGRFQQALGAVERALVQFRRAEIDRGIGLGLLTLGTIRRNLAETWREMDLTMKEALRYLDQAETDLKDAVRIFSVSVKEPIREVQARNELACCYRARYLLLVLSNAPEADRDLSFAQARTHFLKAIEVARQNHYTIEELDSMQDLAVLFMRARRFKEAEDLLEEIREKIPETYKIREGEGLKELDESKCIDAYYKLMGQVDLLAGAIIYERGRLSDPDGKPTRETLLETAHHDLLAASYFDRYSGDAYARSQTFARIYKRFQECDPDLVSEITKNYLPALIEKYKLPDELVRSLFRDVFGLFD